MTEEESRKKGWEARLERRAEAQRERRDPEDEEERN